MRAVMVPAAAACTNYINKFAIFTQAFAHLTRLGHFPAAGHVLDTGKGYLPLTHAYILRLCDVHFMFW